VSDKASDRDRTRHDSVVVVGSDHFIITYIGHLSGLYELPFHSLVRK
jgi:hypothetical protein